NDENGAIIAARTCRHGGCTIVVSSLLQRAAVAMRYRALTASEGGQRMLGTILIVVLILALLGALPTWPYSRDWGYYPGGLLGLVLLIIILLAVTGRM